MTERAMRIEAALMRGRTKALTTNGLRIIVCLGALLAAVVPLRASDDEPDFLDRFGETLKNGMGSAGKAVGLGKPAPPPEKEAPSGCPTISILDGTTAQRVMAPGETGNAGLRHQFSLLNVGRECSNAGSRMSVKVGATGRVLLGPAGSAGHYEVPIRVVIVSDFDGKPVESKLYRVPANVAAGQPSVAFEFVSDQIAVPIGAGRTGGDYSIKVGIDGGAKGTEAVKPTKVRHRKAAKASESASQ